MAVRLIAPDNSGEVATGQASQGDIIRVGQFTDSYPPIINGVSTFVSEHHLELINQGVESSVFTFGRPVAEHQPQIFRTHGIRLMDQPFQANFRLNRAGRNAADQLDVFHVHEPFLIAYNADRIARRRGSPIVFTNHTRHDLYAKNFPYILQPFLKRYITSRVAHMIRVSALASTPSQDAAQWMRALVPDLPTERIQVMRNGIDLRAFVNSAKSDVRAKVKIPAGRVLFIYVGRLTPEKNLIVTAEAFKQAVQAGADAEWLIVGDGLLRETLVEILEPVCEHVHFVGKVPRDVIASYVALADVFLTASLSEINPMSIIEALAFGLPYVGVQSPWWNEFRSTAPAGILTEHDPSALAATIRQLCDLPAQRAELSQGARTLSAQFDIRSVTAHWIALYKELSH